MYIKSNDFLRVLFGHPSDRLRKKPLFSEADPKKSGS